MRGLPTFAVATAGVLVGHHLTYLLAHPGADDRHAALARTGHDYLPSAGKVVLALLLAGALTLVLRVCARGPFRDRGPDTIASLVAALWVTQAIVFVSIEVLERLVVGAPLGELAGGSILSVGLLALVAPALLGALALRWFHRAVGVVLTAIARHRARPVVRSPLRPGFVVAPAPPLLSGAAGVRGPPPSFGP
ncbi:MAG: hypothetical protein WD206_00600 [Actinomycetota bacterium]